MTRPNIEGWDDEAQAWWDQASPTEKATALEDFANKVTVGNTRSHLLAAARYIALSDGWQEPEPVTRAVGLMGQWKCCCKRQTGVHCGECDSCVRGDGCGYGPEGNVIGMSRQPVRNRGGATDE